MKFCLTNNKFIMIKKVNNIVIAPPRETQLTAYMDWLVKRNIPFRVLKQGDSFSPDEMLMLCGGPDYGKQIERDRQELEWIHWAFEQKNYIVGICRGMQIMNIAMGGTLIDDISTKIKHSANSNDVSGDKHLKESEFHEVKFFGNEWNNFLTEKKSETMMVNSRHHQAIDRLVPILTIDAIADDGIIEAASTPSINLVQWHPERTEVFDMPCEKYVSEWIKERLIKK